ncbi:AAA family ATPase [Aeromicrobium panaciterrae]
MLFGDLVGFTTLSESRDPEEVRELLTDYFEECRAVVARYGGELEKFIGDAVMAVWGLPVTREDDAERAVRAGLELVERVSALGERINVPGLSMRVGITTAEVAVTLGATGQGMVAGDPVNTAARIQAAAAPGQVWIDETTRTFTSSAITYDDAGSHAMKGKAEPVPLWSVRAVVANIGGDRRDDGLEAPLIGRDRELRLVKEVFHGIQASLRPGMLVVDGEAGIGKSRLGWEFEKYVDGLDADVLWHRGRCLSYGEGVAYYALAEAVRSRISALAGSGAEDPDGRPPLHEALVACVHEESDREWLEPRLAALLGQDTSTAFTRDDLFLAWTTFFRYAGEAADAPVVLVVDDAQYADDALVDFLEHLLTAADFSVFVLVLARPELLAEHAGLVGNRRVTVVHLEALSDAEMAELVDELVTGVPDEIRSELVSRAEGVPLFAIETVRSLIDQEVVVLRDGAHVLADPDGVDLTTLAAPKTLQALIAARLDTLPEDERRVVDRASVLGLVFTDQGITAICEDVPDLEHALANLFRREVLRRETDRMNSEFGSYRFVQGVVRQVAYGMLARRDRKASHLNVATKLAAELAVRSEAYELAPIIAQHYLDAIDAVPGDPDVPELTQAASEHLELAADRAAGLGAPREAAAYLALALERCAPERRLAVQSRLARQLRLSGDHGAAIEHAGEAVIGFEAAGDLLGMATATEDLARALVYDEGDLGRAEQLVRDMLERLPEVPTDPPVLEARFDLVGALATVLLSTGGSGLAAVAQEALTLGELTGDPRRIADSWSVQALSCSDSMPHLAALLFEQAATLAGEHRAVRERSAALLNLTALKTFEDVSEAILTGREAMESGREIGEEIVLAFATSNLATALLLDGEWEEAALLAGREDVQKFLAFTSDIALRYQAIARGEDRAPVVEMADQAPEGIEDPTVLAEYYTDRALESLGAGRADAARLAMEGVRRIVESASTSIDIWLIWIIAAEVVRAQGDRESAVALLELATVRGGPLPQGVRAQHARLRAFAGEDGSLTDEAVEEAYRDALSSARGWGASLFEAHVAADLGRWVARQGRHDESNDLVDQAREVYRRIGATRWRDDLPQRF